MKTILYPTAEQYMYSIKSISSLSSKFVEHHLMSKKPQKIMQT